MGRSHLSVGPLLLESPAAEGSHLFERPIPPSLRLPLPVSLRDPSFSDGVFFSREPTTFMGPSSPWVLLFPWRNPLFSGVIPVYRIFSPSPLCGTATPLGMSSRPPTRLLLRHVPGGAPCFSESGSPFIQVSPTFPRSPFPTFLSCPPCFSVCTSLDDLLPSVRQLISGVPACVRILLGGVPHFPDYPYFWRPPSFFDECLHTTLNSDMCAGSSVL